MNKELIQIEEQEVLGALKYSELQFTCILEELRQALDTENKKQQWGHLKELEYKFLNRLEIQLKFLERYMTLKEKENFDRNYNDFLASNRRVKLRSI